MSASYVYVNGAIVDSDAPTLSPTDRGLLYGDGLYETIRVRQSRPVRFESHMHRLRAGASVLGFWDSIAETDFGRAIGELLRANALDDARVRITITRGPAEATDVLPPDEPSPTVIILARPLPEVGLEPVSVIVSSVRRDERSPLCAVKTTNCLPAIVARIEARERGADDAIMLNTSGGVAEATSANVFVVEGTRLVTPALDQGILRGTARSAVLELADGLGLEPVECEVAPDRLSAANEVFLTSAIKLVRPVCEIEGRPVGSGERPVARAVLDELLRVE